MTSNGMLRADQKSEWRSDLPVAVTTRIPERPHLRSRGISFSGSEPLLLQVAVGLSRR
jgi:hypothetical protein